MKFAFILVLLIAPCYAQMPESGGFPMIPDEWLLGQGRKSDYRTTTANPPAEVVYRDPIEKEINVVNRASEIFNKSTAKAIALVNNGEIVWIKYKAPASEKSIFYSLSMGKTLASMATGKAICAGKLSIDAVTEDIVPEMKGTDLGKATVRDLLRMSSGTSAINHDSSIMSEEQSEGIWSGKISFLDVLMTPKVNASRQGSWGNKQQPGRVFDYHGTDPLMISIILNRSTGINYAKWLEQEVLLPAGIKNSVTIAQDYFGFGQTESGIRMTLEDWVRFAIWVKKSESGSDCFANYLKQASHTQIKNLIKREGKLFDGYGYFMWTENNRLNDSYWAVGYGGQRIAWNHRNQRILIAFSNVENYMDDLYLLYRDWALIKD